MTHGFLSFSFSFSVFLKSRNKRSGMFHAENIGYAGIERHEIFLKHHILEGSGRDNDKVGFCGKKQHCVAGTLVISANITLTWTPAIWRNYIYGTWKNCTYHNKNLT